MAIFLWVAIRRTVRLYMLVRSPEAAFGIGAIGVSITLALFGTSLYRQHEYSIILIMMIGVSAGEELRNLRWTRQGARKRDTTGAGSAIGAT
jgi:hypothetical protein